VVKDQYSDAPAVDHGQTTKVVTSKLISVWGSLARNWLYLAAFSLPVLVLVGVWVGFIHQKFGSWGLSTMNGYHLVQHTGVFFEYVPDEYAALRDTYLKYRDERMARFGTQANTIWEAIPEMEQVSDLGFYQLSDLLAKISVRLILEHPFLYARNLMQGWWMFWYAPVYWSANSLRWPLLAPIIRGLILVERGILFASNMVFIITSLLVVFWKRARQFRQVSLPWGFLLSTIWVTSVVQTILDHGDNPRFLIPLQSLVILWVLWIIWTMISRQRKVADRTNKKNGSGR
jgi:hypothetical protein